MKNKNFAESLKNMFDGFIYIFKNLKLNNYKTDMI